ncbi:50S ribosomal protein L25/general stress protein Ctc [Thermoanaerobacterium thermosaccharolyticum]|jgi:large subunit ribosomal protein L25|uniref:Large ribosomal subunit protein bL25 n=3 Tax=Thermoanaerobacterium thermosaccharolyticum TaxID=1517 RepID=D9TT28_THETC|nr:50S ribosomal protein L25/general stress protein Ctc [Thermoanaerobacterium thermosaccharolyticum]TCW38056.1 large subunit ribosomal protein L25 [Thermohydrogenium kirishiense]ADL68170.1 ribosomal 5S rRNA E-loop binding protein Ctc/L25/TL5 [Thermoanaerobacterium thermosaccharolyticum DSM 571]AGB18297.1 ribosomal protein L25, Ctc-form [Thermoanaerobacterium thermosaccharolyticum M0795]KAA5808475.1 50S ribosomal protein L25/general stress protein Ctc [Thermoanaerobacterium thermosaccharolyticu
MQNVELEAVLRVPGKNAARKLKEKGYIPAILYGKGMESIPLAVETGKLRTIVQKHGRNVLLNLVVNGATHQAILKDEQRDELTGKLIHIDFQRVSMNEKIEAAVPLKLEGVGVIESKGLLVQHQKWELNVESLPTSLPDEIVVDVSNLKIGDTLFVKDVNVPEGVEKVDDPDEVILTIVAPKNADVPETDESVETSSENG